MGGLSEYPPCLFQRGLDLSCCLGSWPAVKRERAGQSLLFAGKDRAGNVTYVNFYLIELENFKMSSFYITNI